MPPRGLQAFDAAAGPNVLELLAEYDAITADSTGDHPRTLSTTTALLAGYLSVRRQQLAERAA